MVRRPSSVSYGRRSVLACLSACGLFVVGGGAPAHAASGVHIDPSSPAGTEYAIPLDTLRHQYGGGGPGSQNPATAAGGSGGGGRLAASGTGRSGGGSVELFGTGIAPRPTARSAGPRAGHRTATSSAGLGAAIANHTEGAVSTTAASAGIVALVLLLGGGLAALARPRRPKRG